VRRLIPRGPSQFSFARPHEPTCEGSQEVSRRARKGRVCEGILGIGPGSADTLTSCR
jgi:hypothetical protein